MAHWWEQRHKDLRPWFESHCGSSSIVGAARLLVERSLPLDLETYMTVSVHFLSDGQIDSNDIWYTDVS
jgi:hypothetical protein